MIDFWAVLGLSCIDKEFHHGLMRKLGKPRRRRLLQEWLDGGSAGCETPYDFVLSRMEIVEIVDLFRQNINGTIDRIRAAHGECCYEKAAEVDHDGLPPRSKHYCAVIGLACIDGAFRENLQDCKGKVAQTKKLLTKERPRLPCVEGSSGSADHRDEYDALSKAFKKSDMLFMMDQLQKEGWWHPEMVFGACPQGHTLGRNQYVLPATGKVARDYAGGRATRDYGQLFADERQDYEEGRVVALEDEIGDIHKCLESLVKEVKEVKKATQKP